MPLDEIERGEWKNWLKAQHSTQQWPQDWKRSVFIPIPKKGKAKECSNYCIIALISCSQFWIQVSEIMWQEKRGLGHRCPTKGGIREMQVDRVCPVQSGGWILNLSDMSSQLMGELVCLGETFSSDSRLPWVWPHVHQTVFRWTLSLAGFLIPGRRLF